MCKSLMDYKYRIIVAALVLALVLAISADTVLGMH